ncbi:MAG: hypothetical protein VKJ04_00615 [Vampirovibrionales bacterium]|nr:hypothetical protein [Vampirovibrionales bacterium]
MSDTGESVWAKSDKKRVTIVTRTFRFEGYLHTPKVGKESRRISELLNADRNFLAITQATVTEIATGNSWGETHEMLQVSLSAIEYVKPHLGE